MLSPMFLGWVVDQVLVTADRDLLMTLAFGFLLLLVLQTSLSALRSWMLMGLNASLKVQSRANLFTHLLNLPPRISRRAISATSCRDFRRRIRSCRR